MRPWQHAMSSSRPTRDWTQDLEIHEFMDMTKACCADRRHRMILHSIDLGVELAGRAFPSRHEAADVARQHVIEDMGHACTLMQWLESCDPTRLPRPLPRRLPLAKDCVVAVVAQRLHPACHDAIAGVYDLLTLPCRFAPGAADLALCVLMNAFGPAISRRIIGPPCIAMHEHGQAVIDAGWIAEAITFTIFGRIPDLGEIVRCCINEPVTSPHVRRDERHGN